MLHDASVVVTGGASGLGRATALALRDSGVGRVIVLDLPDSEGAEFVAAELGPVGEFFGGDVRDADAVEKVMNRAASLAPLRAVIHCAGRGASLRVVTRDGLPGPIDTFTEIVSTNLIGTFNVLRLAAAVMARNAPVDDVDGRGDRGVCVLTASVAAFEGQIGQVAYAASKAGVHGMTLVAARDLASRRIRVCTIAPGTFETPMLLRLAPEVRASLAEAIPHPRRLGRADEYAKLALHIIDNPMLNGETIRLDGALRMSPR